MPPYQLLSLPGALADRSLMEHCTVIGSVLDKFIVDIDASISGPVKLQSCIQNLSCGTCTCPPITSYQTSLVKSSRSGQLQKRFRLIFMIMHIVGGALGLCAARVQPVGGIPDYRAHVITAKASIA